MNIKRICLISALIASGVNADEGIPSSYSLEFGYEKNSETGYEVERRIVYLDSIEDVHSALGLNKSLNKTGGGIGIPTPDHGLCTERFCIEYFSGHSYNFVDYEVCDYLAGGYYEQHLHFERMHTNDPQYSPSGFRLTEYYFKPSLRDDCVHHHN